MSKLDPLKAKIANLKTTIIGKLGNIPVLKRFFAQKEPITVSKKEVSIAQIYRDGEVGTRLQVIIFYLFVLACLGSGTFFSLKIWKKIKPNKAASVAAQEYSHGLEEMKHKVEERAEMISIGSMTVNAYIEEASTKMVKIDVWAKTSSPQIAALALKEDVIWHDKTLEALNKIYREKVNLMSHEGKELAKKAILNNLNSQLKEGKIEEIYFHNLVIQ